MTFSLELKKWNLSTFSETESNVKVFLVSSLNFLPWFIAKLFIFLSKFNFKFKRLRLFLLNYLRKRINDEAKRIRLCRGTVCENPSGIKLSYISNFYPSILHVYCYHKVHNFHNFSRSIPLCRLLTSNFRGKTKFSFFLFSRWGKYLTSLAWCDIFPEEVVLKMMKGSRVS